MKTHLTDLTVQELRDGNYHFDIIALCGRLVTNFYGIDDPLWRYYDERGGLCKGCKKTAEAILQARAVSGASGETARR